MESESLNWFRFAKCLADTGNKVLSRNLYFHASTCSLSAYHDVWQQKVKDHCQSDELNILWTSLKQQSSALDVTIQPVFKILLSKWKNNISGTFMEIRKQLCALKSWEIDLLDTISKHPAQQKTLTKFLDEIQKLVTDQSLLLTVIRNWTKDFIHQCYMNQLDMLHWIEQHNERTCRLMSIFLQKFDVIYMRLRSKDLINDVQECQQDERNASSELRINLHTSFIFWQSTIDKFIDSWITNIPKCINQNILHNLLTHMRNDLPGVHNICQVNINDICSTWHTNLQKELAELNHQLQQVAESTGDLQNLARKWHEKLKAFPSISQLQIKEFFDSKKTDLHSLKKRHTITETQWSLMFPSKGSINLQAFDITLSTTLLRNICPVLPPELGWSDEILDTDHSMGADLMRLKQYRNEYVGHVPHLAMPRSDFEKIWAILETILYRLSMPVGNDFWQKIQQEITELKTCSFDVHEEMKLQLELLKWYNSDSDQKQDKQERFCKVLEGKVENLSNQNVVLLSEMQQIGKRNQDATEEQLKEINEKLARMEDHLSKKRMKPLERIEQRITDNKEYISDQRLNRTKQKQRTYLTKGKISRHIDNKKDVDVRTRAYGYARATLLEHRHLVLRGKPGDGKTHTALSLMADLMKTIPEMWPIEINTPDEWEKLVDLKQPLIVLMDDVLGKYEISETDLGKWKKLSECIYPNISESCVFLIICFRDQIALKAKRSLPGNEAFSWMFDSHVINISGDNYCLTNNEKADMLRKYAKKHLKQTNDLMIDSVVNMKHVIGFPQNCKLWSCGKNLALKDVYANNMFIVEEIQKFSKQSHQDYLFLVLLMLSGGSLSLDNGEEIRNKIKKISELCGVRGDLNIGQCKEIGHSLCNTFAEYDSETKTFRFQHDSFESAVFFCFGNDFPDLTLELCSIQVLTKMCCLRNQSNGSDDGSFVNFKIVIDNDTLFDAIVERFDEGFESRKGELFQCIAEAVVWKSTQFLNYFFMNLASSDDVLNFLSKKDIDEQSILVYFVCAGNTLVVKEIVDKISQFDLQDHHDISRQILLATVNACLADKADMFNDLFKLQEKVDDFIMFAAASTGNVSVMQKLLFHGGNLNALISDKLENDLTNTIKNCVIYPNNESYHHDINLLHIACTYGRTDMVMDLKNKCLDLLHKTSSFGFTAAHFVARSENVELLKKLCVEQLDIERKDNDDNTVLHIAAKNGNVQMVKYLTETFPQMALQSDTSGWTVIHCSGCNGSIYVLEALLAKRLDIMARTNNGQNILHISAWFNQQPMVKYLIHTHPELVTQTDNEGNSTVHYAAMGGSVPEMETLIQEGLNITARNNDGSHVLHKASCNDNLSMVNHLIKIVPELIHETNKYGYTALHSAGAGGSVPVIDSLLRAGLEITATTNEGFNVLHLAGLYDNFSTMEYLIKTYPQLKHTINSDGMTVLHCCCQYGSLNSLKLLLQEGCDITAKTNEGFNVFFVAMGNENLTIANYICQQYPQFCQELMNDFCTAVSAPEGEHLQGTLTARKFKLIWDNIPENIIQDLINMAIDFASRIEIDTNVNTDIDLD